MLVGASAKPAHAAYAPAVVAQANVPATSPGQTGTRPVASKTAPAASPKIASPVAPAPEAKPLWKDLAPEQQASLKPLASSWATISEGQKRKWIALSKNFPAKTPAEQAKLHSRMTEWVSLSQQQRTQARLNFAETKTLPAEEKAAHWKAYQALSPEEKQKLAAKGSPAPTGATSTVKPVPQQKLAKVPSTRRDAAQGTIAAHSPQLDANTLLPLAPGGKSGGAAPTEAPSVRKN